MRQCRPRHALLASLLLGPLLLASASPARAQSAPVAAPAADALSGHVVRIGVLTDESGPYADSAGPGAVAAAQMAVQDFGPTVRGARIEIVHADTQNKPDVAAATARRWFDDGGVDAVIELQVTPVALAVQEVARQKNRTVMITAAAASEFTTRFCSPVSTQWSDDTHSMAAGAASALLAAGRKTWYFVTVDMAFGNSLQQAATEVIDAGGGRVLGAARYPIGATDYAALLLNAQASGAQVVGLASVGNDLVNLIKQASEFGIAPRQTLAGFLIYINDIHALGLQAAQGFQFVSGFYWDQDDAARAFGRRFMAARGAMPSRDQAEIYVAITHYLRAIDRAGTDDAVAVNRAMRAMPVDYFGHPASVRSDGRVLFDETLYRVKTPAESHGPWDLYAPVRTIPAAEAFLPPNLACKE